MYLLYITRGCVKPWKLVFQENHRKILNFTCEYCSINTLICNEWNHTNNNILRHKKWYHKVKIPHIDLFMISLLIQKKSKKFNIFERLSFIQQAIVKKSFVIWYWYLEEFLWTPNVFKSLAFNILQDIAFF